MTGTVWTRRAEKRPRHFALSSAAEIGDDRRLKGIFSGWIRCGQIMSNGISVIRTGYDGSTDQIDALIVE